ncbi:hypothetical protein [Blautia sp. 1033sp1_1033st1_G9_1033SCRN_220408]|uniref:hypothetical protein n=1 Tax=Blautia sp. 1033sp1_1033st1_G9_1033SCRN_220408 TaxID=3144490 RepID=UPI0034A36CD9
MEVTTLSTAEGCPVSPYIVPAVRNVQEKIEIYYLIKKGELSAFSAASSPIFKLYLIFWQKKKRRFEP